MVLPMLLGQIALDLPPLIVIFPINAARSLLEAWIRRITTVAAGKVRLCFLLLAIKAVHRFIVLVLKVGMFFRMRVRAGRNGVMRAVVIGVAIIRRIATVIRCSIAAVIGRVAAVIGRRTIMITIPCPRPTTSSEEHPAQRHNPEKRTSIHRMLLLK